MSKPSEFEIGRVHSLLDILQAGKEGIDGLDKADLILDRATEILEEFIKKYGKMKID